MNKPRILLIDDSEISRENTRDILHEAGFKVTSMASATGVAAVVKNHAPDLVLMDVSMPAVGGDTAVEVMREAGVKGRVVLYSAKPAEKLKTLAIPTQDRRSLKRFDQPSR